MLVHHLYLTFLYLSLETGFMINLLLQYLLLLVTSSIYQVVFKEGFQFNNKDLPRITPPPLRLLVLYDSPIKL